MKGNFALVARLDSLTYANPNAMAGIQIRTSTADNAVYANIFVQTGKLVGRFRTGGDYSTTVRSQDATLPVWLKIARGPNPWNITTYTSADGVSWTEFTKGDFWAWSDPATELTAGLFVTAGAGEKYATAEFSDVAWPVDPAARMNR